MFTQQEVQGEVYQQPTPPEDRNIYKDEVEAMNPLAFGGSAFNDKYDKEHLVVPQDTTVEDLRTDTAYLQGTHPDQNVEVTEADYKELQALYKDDKGTAEKIFNYSPKNKYEFDRAVAHITDVKERDQNIANNSTALSTTVAISSLLMGADTPVGAIGFAAKSTALGAKAARATKVAYDTGVITAGAIADNTMLNAQNGDELSKNLEMVAPLALGIGSVVGVLNNKAVKGAEHQVAETIQKNQEEIVTSGSKSEVYKAVPKGFIADYGVSPIMRTLNSANVGARELAEKFRLPSFDIGVKVNNDNMDMYIKEGQSQFNREILTASKNDWYEFQKANPGKGFKTHKEYIDNAYHLHLRHVGQEQEKIIKNLNVVGKSDEEIDKMIKEAIESHDFNVKYQGPVANTINSFTRYFEETITKGKELGISGLNEATGKGYAIHMYDGKAAIAMKEDKFVAKLVNAQIKKYKYKYKRTPDEKTLNEFTGGAQRAWESSQDSNKMTAKFYRDADPKHKGSKDTSRQKQRSLDFFEHDVSDLLYKEPIETMLSYDRSMLGKFAMKKHLGVDTMDDFVDTMKGLKLSDEEIQDFTAMIQTIGGFREISHYDDVTKKAAHMGSTVSSLLHTLGFLLPAVTEITNMAVTSGFRNTFKNLNASYKIMKKVGRGERLTQKELQAMGSFHDVGGIHWGKNANKFDTTGSLQELGSFQEMLDSGVHKLSLASGMPFATDMMRVASNMAAQDFIMDLALGTSKMTKANVKRMNTLGLDQADLDYIKSKITYKNGVPLLNQSKWKGNMSEKFDRATMASVYQSILEPDGMTLPRSFSDGNNIIVREIFGKFLRFPIDSIEKIMAKGISEADARVFLGNSMNIVMWSNILMAKNYVNGGDRYEGDDGEQKLMMDSIMMSTIVGGISVPFQFFNQVTNKDAYGDTGGVVISDIQSFGSNFNAYGMKPVKYITSAIQSMEVMEGIK